MHVHTKRPDCYSAVCTERGERWLGKGRECGNFRDAEGRDRYLFDGPEAYARLPLGAAILGGLALV